MAETTDLKKIWFVVSPHNPFKHSKSLLHEFDRYDMVRAAIADNYKFEVTDIEFQLPKPSYTIHTLIHLSEKHPDKEFKVIVGEDNLEQFANWKNYNQILENYGLYIYPRPNVTKSDLIYHHNVRLVDAPKMDISATFIRHCIRNNYSIRYLVPEAVEELIRLKKFYR